MTDGANGHPHRDRLIHAAAWLEKIAGINAPPQALVDQAIDAVANALKRIFG